jgi:hypothetical protein
MTLYLSTEAAMLPRGYNVASVNRLFFGLRCQIFRAHSENAGKWPFCTGGNPKHWPILFPIEWVRTIFDKKDQQCGVSNPLLPVAGCVVGKEVQGADRHPSTRYAEKQLHRTRVQGYRLETLPNHD